METQEVIDYIKQLPTPLFYDELTDTDKKKHIFNAMEEISDVLIKFPNIKASTRMIALQTLYNLEGEEEGIAMLRRQGITDYTVKDIKAVLDKQSICPSVLAIIDAINDADVVDEGMRVGRLI
ncbi:hypothetical protein ACFP67_14230 [Mammaliicoccus sciuri]|uniref:hypothetical protein n=1 Tax=Mammaliicoccus sciuri TaxID=1296 RepID=UPI000CD02549|nr:hypothetical protein [Mammaliicoccus sciuri]PNZ29976.1 hypothetical protein CD114_01090 [Mammaliicoccus sciuri]